MGAQMQTQTDGLQLMEACTVQTRQGQIMPGILANNEANDLLGPPKIGTDLDRRLKEAEGLLGEQ